MTATTSATTPLSVPVFGNPGCFGVGGTSVVTGGSSVVVVGGVYVLLKALSSGYATDISSGDFDDFIFVRSSFFKCHIFKGNRAICLGCCCR